jgi:hypothetical protein
VSGEFVIPDLIAELVSVRLEIELDPSDVVFGSIRMSNLFSEGHGHMEKLVNGHLSGAFNNRDVFLSLPVGRLKQFSYSTHFLLLRIVL